MTRGSCHVGVEPSDDREGVGTVEKEGRRRALDLEEYDMARLPKPARLGGLMNLLPPQIKAELKQLESDRDDANVSAAEWHARADKLIAKGLALPGPMRDMFVRSVRGLASNEKELERQTGKLVGLSADANENEVREAELALRQRIERGDITSDEAADLRGRLSN